MTGAEARKKGVVMVFRADVEGYFGGSGDLVVNVMVMVDQDDGVMVEGMREGDG
jgi:hypothetical protein